MKTSPRPENGAAGSAHSPQRAACRAGPRSPRSPRGGGSGLRVLARRAAKVRRGAGVPLTVAFVSSARSSCSRSDRRLRGSYSPRARSCAPRRARRFLAPALPAQARARVEPEAVRAPGKAGGRASSRSCNCPREAPPPAGPAPSAAPGSLRPLPRLGNGLAGGSGDPEDLNHSRLEAACEDSGGPRTGAGARTDIPENGDHSGACGSPCPLSWVPTHAPPRQRGGAVPALDLGQRTRAGEGASVLSGRWNKTSLSGGS